MGYSYEMFADIACLSLKKGGRVLDLGSQDLFVGDAQQLEAINRFIDGSGGDRLSEQRIGQSIEAREVWQHAGYQYSCVDIDERPQTIKVDLQNFHFPPELRNGFDLVTNMGTTEHLATPAVGLALMHFACKPHGWLFSDVPVFGWGNHGLVNLTPKFWHLLQFINGYKVAACKLRKDNEDEFDPGNFFYPQMDYMEGIRAARSISWMFRLIARKPSRDRSFIPPYDALLPESDGSKEAETMLGLMRPYLLAGIWTKHEAADAINDALRRLGKSYRVQDAATDPLPYLRTVAATKAYRIQDAIANPLPHLRTVAKKSPVLTRAVRAAKAAIRQTRRVSK